MIKYIFIAAVFSFCVNTYSQNAVLSFDKMNVLYIGIDNPVELAGNNIDCKDIRIETVNMKINCDSNCKCIARTESQGNAIFIAYNKENRIIDSSTFIAKIIPNPSTGQGNYGCKVSARTRIININMVLSGVTGKKEGVVRSDVFDWDELTLNPDTFNTDSLSIISFNAFLQKKVGESRLISNTGSLFNAELKAIMNKLYTGDVIYFEDIKVMGPDNITRKIPGIAFKID